MADRFDPEFWRLMLQEWIVLNFPGAAFGTVDPRDPAAEAHHFAFAVDDFAACQRDPARLRAAIARAFVSLRLILESAMDEDGVSLVLCQIEGMQHFPRLMTVPTGAIRGLIRHRPVRELATHRALPCLSEDT